MHGSRQNRDCAAIPCRTWALLFGPLPASQPGEGQGSRWSEGLAGCSSELLAAAAMHVPAAAAGAWQWIHAV